MMKPHPPDSAHSPFYPPRARWFSRLWYPWNHLRNISFLRQIPPRGDLSVAQFAMACLVPGYILRCYQYRQAAVAVTLAYFAALLVFFVAFGHLAANLAFGLMIGTHATSLALLLQRWLQPEHIKGRIMLSVLSLLIVGAFIYLPLRSAMLARFLPLDTAHGVVLIRRESAPATLLPGQTIVFEVKQDSVAHGVVVLGGYAIEPVLAVAGDRIVFTGQGFQINGELRPALKGMPKRGEIVVPENHFFVWPRFDITIHNQSADVVSGGLLSVSMIARDQIIGRPCRRWFGLRQPEP